MSEGHVEPGWFNPETGQWDLEQPSLPAFMTHRHRPAGGPCFPTPENGHNCTLTEGHDGPHVCCDGHEWTSTR